MIKMGRRANKHRGERGNGRGRGKSHNRGAGNRGGKGRAGSGKKGDCKKPSYWKTESFGKKAFGMNSSEKLKVINIGKVQERIDSLIATKKVKNDEVVALNLTELGFEKLLGSGSLKSKVNITVNEASDNAITKIEAAGGKIIISGSEDLEVKS